MNTSTAYIAVAIVVLAVIAALVFLVKGKEKERGLSPLGGLALACVVAGIVFSADRLVGYSLMGVGVLLAIVDMVNRLKRK